MNPYTEAEVIGLLERPIDTVITLDFETFYGSDYTLSKLTTEAYIRDPRFETILVGVKVGAGETRWLDPEAFEAWVATVNWARVACLAHHAHFDGFILSHHYGVSPGFWLDTLSMARALHGTEVGGSLKKLMPYYGIGEKGEEVVHAINKRRADFSPEEYARYGAYCCNDVDGAYQICQAMLASGFPEVEIHLIDRVVRMFTEPRLQLNRPLLEKSLLEERARKKALLDRVAQEKDALSSSNKFAQLLIDLGEDPPVKVTPKGNEIYAFAKTDPGMQALLDHERDEIRWLAEARIGIKNTITETRTERLLGVGSRGPVPVYLKYYGAHTGRYSGGDKMNFQNLTRGSDLRKALVLL